VVVQVGATDSVVGDAEFDVPRPAFRFGHLLDLDVLTTSIHGCPHDPDSFG
jgi:hypothetical protein